jgi:hypothetical protein
MDDTQLLKTTLSQHGGELSALTAVIVSLCESLPPDSQLAKHIVQRLEEAYSMHLQNSTNPAYLEGFEEMSELIKESLQFQPGD